MLGLYVRSGGAMVDVAFSFDAWRGELGFLQRFLTFGADHVEVFWGSGWL